MECDPFETSFSHQMGTKYLVGPAVDHWQFPSGTSMCCFWGNYLKLLDSPPSEHPNQQGSWTWSRVYLQTIQIDCVELPAFYVKKAHAIFTNKNTTLHGAIGFSMANKYPCEGKGNTQHPTIYTTTPPKFNMAPEKLPSQKVSTISNHPFSGAMLNFRWVYITLEKHHHRSPKSLDGLEMMFHDSFHFPKGRVSDCHWFPTQVMKTKSLFLVSYISRRWILKSSQILLMEEILRLLMGSVSHHLQLGGGFKYFLFSPLFGEDFPFD